MTTLALSPIPRPEPAPSPVPEPSTLALLAAGVIALLLKRKGK